MTKFSVSVSATHISIEPKFGHTQSSKSGDRITQRSSKFALSSIWKTLGMATLPWMQPMLKWKPIHMAEFEFVLFSIRNALHMAEFLYQYPQHTSVLSRSTHCDSDGELGKCSWNRCLLPVQLCHPFLKCWPSRTRATTGRPWEWRRRRSYANRGPRSPNVDIEAARSSTTQVPDARAQWPTATWACEDNDNDDIKEWRLRRRQPQRRHRRRVIVVPTFARTGIAQFDDGSDAESYTGRGHIRTTDMAHMFAAARPIRTSLAIGPSWRWPWRWALMHITIPGLIAIQ